MLTEKKKIHFGLAGTGPILSNCYGPNMTHSLTTAMVHVNCHSNMKTALQGQQNSYRQMNKGAVPVLKGISATLHCFALNRNQNFIRQSTEQTRSKGVRVFIGTKNGKA